MEKSSGVIASLLIAASLASAQPIEPKASASAYPVHAKLGALSDFSIGADFLVHTIPGELGGLFAGDFLTIEAAFFGPKESRAEIRSAHFRLRINGSKIPLAAQPAGSVAASLKYTDWENPRTLTVDGAYNDKRVIYTPRQEPRFPGDNRGGATVDPPPGQPEAPVKAEAKLTIDERVDKASLPEGKLELPRGGLLYFLFKGKTKSIKSLELLYDGPLGKATFKLI